MAARRLAGPLALVVLAAAACSGSDDAATSTTSTATVPETTPATEPVAPASDQFPDVVDARATFDAGSGTWIFDVTISSPYDSAERYADGWRVIGPDGTVFGVHTLGHDHANEQPFTRTQRGVEIPDDIVEVTIEGRDQANGFGGNTVTVVLAP